MRNNHDSEICDIAELLKESILFKSEFKIYIFCIYKFSLFILKFYIYKLLEQNPV